MMIKLMEVGEKTGTLETSMQAVADHMDYEVTKSLEKFTTEFGASDAGGGSLGCWRHDDGNYFPNVWRLAKLGQ